MSGIAPAQVPPFRLLFRNIWTRSDPTTTTPLLDDSSGQPARQQDIMEDSTTDPTSQSLQHKYSTSDGTSSAPSKSGTGIETVGQGNSKTETGGSGIEDLMSRGDVFAGVLVFSVGMLVLIIAVTFYFANGRSLRTVRSNRGLANSNTQQRHGGQEVDGGDVDLEQNVQAATTTATATTGTGTGDKGEAGTGEKSTTFDPHSPSTARLIHHHHHHPTTSVFAFLKGNTSIPSHHYDPSGSMFLKSSPISATSIISKTGQDHITPDDKGSTTLHMPILTKIKARDSCKKKKGKGMINFFTSATSSSSGASGRKQRRQQQKQAALEIARSASAIIIQVQEPSEPSSAAPLAPLDTYMHTHPSNSSNPTSSLNSPGAEPSEDDVFSPIRPTSTISEAPPQMSILRLEMPTTIRSSSVVGLYGSAKSSPNGSMVDAASTRAIYCTSLKSAISFLPTESTSTLGVLHNADLGGGGGGGGGGGAGAGQDSNGKEIVIAIAGLEAS